jgi:hypothetical protein
MTNNYFKVSGSRLDFELFFFDDSDPLGTLVKYQQANDFLLKVAAKVTSDAARLRVMRGLSVFRRVRLNGFGSDVPVVGEPT